MPFIVLMLFCLALHLQYQNDIHHQSYTAIAVPKYFRLEGCFISYSSYANSEYVEDYDECYQDFGQDGNDEEYLNMTDYEDMDTYEDDQNARLENDSYMRYVTEHVYHKEEGDVAEVDTVNETPPIQEKEPQRDDPGYARYYRVPESIITSGESQNMCGIYIYLLKRKSEESFIGISLNDMIIENGYVPNNKTSINNQRYIGYKLRQDISWLVDNGYITDIDFDKFVGNEYVKIQIDEDMFRTSHEKFGIVFDFELEEIRDFCSTHPSRKRLMGNMITMLLFIRMNLWRVISWRDDRPQTYAYYVNRIGEFMGMSSASARKALDELVDLGILACVKSESYRLTNGEMRPGKTIVADRYKCVHHGDRNYFIIDQHYNYKDQLSRACEYLNNNKKRKVDD